MIDYGEIEAGLLEGLEGTLAAFGVRSVGMYSGQLDKGLREAVVAFPAVYVSLLGVEYREHNRADLVTARVAVFCCDRSLRGSEGRAGAQGLLEAVRGAWHRRAVLPGRWEPLRVERERVLWLDPGTGMAVCEGRYFTRNVV